MTNKPAVERMVLHLFGRVIRPTNWIILGLGTAFVLMSFYQLFVSHVAFIDFLILLGTGLCMTAQGYEVVKDDEDL